MEEKERYIIDRFDGDIFDTKKGYYPSNQTICEIINQQDKQIKELKKENKELEIKIDKCGTELVNAESLVSYLENENQQLKQQLHDLPKKIVEEIRDVAGDYWDFNICEECGNVPDLNTLTMEDFDEILDTILEKFGA